MAYTTGSVWRFFNHTQGIVLPSIFEKHKTCLNRTKLLLIVN